jgi:hypothetical protein
MNNLDDIRSFVGCSYFLMQLLRFVEVEGEFPQIPQPLQSCLHHQSCLGPSVVRTAPARETHLRVLLTPLFTFFCSSVVEDSLRRP